MAANCRQWWRRWSPWVVLGLSRLVLLALVVVPCNADASSPMPPLECSIAFEPGSATLSPSQRKSIAELVEQGRMWSNMRVTVGTEASKNDNVALRDARIDMVVRQLQASGVSPSRISTGLADYDAIYTGWLKTIQEAKAGGLWIGPVGLRQHIEIRIVITPGNSP